MNAGPERIQSKAHSAARPAPGWLEGYGEAASWLLPTSSLAPSPRTSGYTGGGVKRHSGHPDGSKCLLRQKSLALVSAFSQDCLYCPEEFFSLILFKVIINYPEFQEGVS